MSKVSCYVTVNDAHPMPTGGLFEDPDGLLALAPKQRALLGRWVRPQDLTPVW